MFLIQQDTIPDVCERAAKVMDKIIFRAVLMLFLNKKPPQLTEAAYK